MNYECDDAMFDDDTQKLYYYRTDILSDVDNDLLL
jgi:hypothetical protein